MDVLMGLLAALLWGGTDFMVGLNARAVGVQRAVFFSQTLGLLLMSLLLVVFPAFLLKLTGAAPGDWGMGVLAACFTLCGALALSKAFSIGKASIVAPVVTSYGVVTTLLAWLGGERLSGLQLACIGLCVVGVILSSITRGSDTPHHVEPRRSIAYALLGALLYGTSLWLQGHFTLPRLGTVGMLWLGYLVGVSLLLVLMLSRGGSLKPPAPRHAFALAGTSLMNLGGFSAFAFGAMAGSVSVVTVISTLSGGIAAILGYLFFKERLAPVQVVGVTLVLLGAMVLHVKA